MSISFSILGDRDRIQDVAATAAPVPEAAARLRARPLDTRRQTRGGARTAAAERRAAGLLTMGGVWVVEAGHGPTIRMSHPPTHHPHKLQHTIVYLGWE